MSVRKTLPLLLLTGALAFGGTACGDKTVTTTPAQTQPRHTPAVGVTGGAADATNVADAELSDVDQLLRDIEGDLSAVDQDAATPEGDPAQ